VWRGPSLAGILRPADLGGAARKRGGVAVDHSVPGKVFNRLCLSLNEVRARPSMPRLIDHIFSLPANSCILAG
jgi:hypothetical protein